MIDYVLVDERFHNGAEFEVVYDHLDSDHHLLVAEIKNVWQITKSTSKPKMRSSIRNTKASEKFQGAIASRSGCRLRASLSTKL